MKNVLITGAAGFIGRYLARELSSRGVRASGIGHGNWTDYGKYGLTSWLNGEVDGVGLDTVAEELGTPSVVYHLAGGSSVAASIRSPLEDFRRTVDTTAQVLAWVRDRAPDARVVLVSSAAVYGNGHAAAITEDTRRAPSSPYGFHKAMAERLCESYVQQFGLHAVAVRFFSVYGPGLRKQLLWDLCTRLAGGESPLTLSGTGAEVRDWIHVRDAARLLSLAGELTAEGMHVLNGGTGEATDVAGIATRVATLWDAPPPHFSGVARAGDPISLLADTHRARAIGFNPGVSLNDGLDETVKWFRRDTVRRS